MQSKRRLAGIEEHILIVILISFFNVYLIYAAWAAL
jgi:hypothetical protein